MSASATQAKGGDKARALTTCEVKEYVQNYRNAARLARIAGFDGVSSGCLPVRCTNRLKLVNCSPHTTG